MTALLLLLVIHSLSAQMFWTRLTDEQQVNPVSSEGQGKMLAVLDPDILELTVSGKFESLEGTYDLYAPTCLFVGSIGEKGQRVLTLNPTVYRGMKSGVFNAAHNTFRISQEEADALLEHRMYVSLASTAYPSGELRGQLVSEREDPLAYVQKKQISGLTSPASPLNQVRLVQDDQHKRLFVQSKKELNVDMRIMDISGKVLQADRLRLQQGDNSLDVADLPAGAYLLSLNHKGKLLANMKWVLW
jgi:hypothetical protein